jgi:serine/threonine protein kinase
MSCQHQTTGEPALCELCQAAPLLQDPLIGSTIGPYEILHRFGEGGFGAVYEGQHTKIERRVAIKVLRAGLADPLLAMKRFQREALALSRLRHPLALRVYEQGLTANGLLYLAMELIEGETLEAYLLRVGLFSEEKLREVFSVLCEVLEEAHQAGITHRDLKPANIMLSVEGEQLTPRLVDFGLAGVLELESLTKSGVVSGTPRYMAPEQWEGLQKTDVRSDLYSLGVLMYECLSGQLPYSASSPLAWMKQHHFEAPRELSQAMGARPLSEAMSRLVMRSISKRPEDRFQSASSLREALLQRGAAPVVALPEPTSTRTKASLRSWLLGSTLAAASFLGVYLASNREDTPPKEQAAVLLSSTSQAAEAPAPSLESTLLRRAEELAVLGRWSEAEAAALAAGDAGAKVAERYHQKAEAAKQLARCKELRAAQKIEEAFVACAPLTQSEDPLAAQEATGSEEAFFALHQKRLQEALTQQSTSGLSLAQRELALLREALGAEYSSLGDLSLAIEAQEKMLNPSAQELLAKITKLQNAKRFDEMCRSIKQYLKTYKNTAEAPRLLKELERYDPAAYPSCEPK